MNIDERIEKLEGENERLGDDLSDVVNKVSQIIMAIAEFAEYDTQYEAIAKDLFEIIENYGDDNAVIDTLEQFAYKTGISLNE